MEAYNALATATELGSHLDGLIRIGPVDLPAGHPVYRLLTKAITEREVQLKAIHLLNLFSGCNANRDQCLRCLMSVGGTMEFLLSKYPVPSASATPLAKTANATLTTAQLASMLSELPQIHVDIIAILINVCEYKIDAAQFLELYNNNVIMCIDALCGFLRHLSVDYPLSVMLVANASGAEGIKNGAEGPWAVATAQANAVIRCVYELSTWKTFREAFYSDNTDVPMPMIQAKFTDHIQLVSKALTASPFLPLVTKQLEDWLDVINVLPDPQISAALIPVAEAALSNALLLITNMMSFTIEFSAKFRQYAAINSGGLLERVVLPMVCLELDILEGKRFTDADDFTDSNSHLARAARMLQMLLKVLGLLCFKVRILRPTLVTQYPFLCKRLITNEVLMNSDFKVEFFALVVRFAINAELDDSVFAILEQHKTKLDARQKLVLALRLANPAERLYPINIFCPIYQQLRDVFVVDRSVASNPDVISALGSTAGGTAPPPKFNFSMAKTGAKPRGPSSIEEKRQARRRAFGLADPAEVFEDEQTLQHMRNVRRRHGGMNTTDKIRTRREAIRRRRAFLNRKARMMKLATGGGANFNEEDEVVDVADDCADDEEGIELQEINTATATAVVNVGVSEAILVDDEDSKAASPTTASDNFEAAVINTAVETQKQQQADVTSVKLKDAPAVVRLTASNDASSAPAAPTAATEAYVQTGPFDLRPYRTVPPPFGVDPRYLCALTKQLMTTPVISPTGDVYEKEAIVAFIKEAGAHKNKCPLTGDDLYPRDLVVDNGLKRELGIVAANYR